MVVSGSDVPCFRPIPALQDDGHVTLHPPLGSANLALPCGRCVGCKTARAQEWATRVMHEARAHESSVFATLTYSPEHLPGDGGLVPRDLQLFLKRLRAVVARGAVHIRGSRLRYLACGEYGDVGGRPHYHAILFGVAFDDATCVRRGDNPLFNSAALEAVWGLGQVNFGEVTRASAAYVAGYTVKKVGQVHCDADGVVKEAPFLRCSTRPGIGAHYARSFSSDFRTGVVVHDGVVGRLPRYYKKLLVREFPHVVEEAQGFQEGRLIERVASDPLGFAPERLIAGEAIALRQQELTRSHSL